MTRIYFQKIYGKFECIKTEGEGREAELVFSEPINAILLIGDRNIKIHSGAGKGDLSALGCGVFTPIIYKEREFFEVGKILITQGGVSTISVGYDDFIKLYSHLDELRTSLEKFKGELETLKEKIDGASLF